MPDLKPITALGSETARSTLRGALSLAENTELALASLALRRGAARPAPFGLTLPDAGGHTSNDVAAAFWTGPDQWMIEAPGRAADDFSGELAALCPGCSVTEQTDAFVAFDIRSSAGEAPILALMSKLVNLDPSRLASGSATRTGLDYMSVFVVRRAPEHLVILGMRSAAASLWHALEIAVTRLADREFAPG